MNLAEAQDWVQFMERTIARIAEDSRLENVARPLLDDLALLRISSNRLTYEQSVPQADEGQELYAVHLLIDALSAIYVRFIVPAALIEDIHTSRIHRLSGKEPPQIQNIYEPSATNPTYPWALTSAEHAATLARSFILMQDATIEKIYQTSDPVTAQRAAALIRSYFAGE